MTESTKPEPELSSQLPDSEAQEENVSDLTREAARILGARGGRKGGKAKGKAKVRGNSLYYKALRAKK